MDTKILSVGGSVMAPASPNRDFLAAFVGMAREWLSAEEGRRLVLVCGGGGPAREWQAACGSVLEALGGSCPSDEADWIGIMATRLNAELLKACFGSLCADPVVTDPTAAVRFTGKVLVAAGWKPGFSTDNDAVLLAQKFGASVVVNLSNIEKVCADDPKKNPEARAIDEITWSGFREIVGDEWVPGKNAPFDPVASRRAQEAGLTVICASGSNVANTRAILDGKPFVGTKISGA